MAETNSAELTWIEGRRFEGRSGSGHPVAVDTLNHEGHQAPNPMELLLVALAGCTAIDVVAILEKMREPLTGLTVSIEGRRADTHPKYFTAIEFVYRIKGRGVSREKAERAVALSHSTYCSASASMRPDCEISSRIELLDEGQ